MKCTKAQRWTKLNWLHHLVCCTTAVVRLFVYITRDPWPLTHACALECAFGSLFYSSPELFVHSCSNWATTHSFSISLFTERDKVVIGIQHKEHHVDGSTLHLTHAVQIPCRNNKTTTVYIRQSTNFCTCSESDVSVVCFMDTEMEATVLVSSMMHLQA